MNHLLPHHLESLQSSGLSLGTIERYRFRSESDPEKIAKMMNWTRPYDVGPSLILPFPSLQGFNGFARIKPDKPRPDCGKYEQPKGEPNHAYVTISAAIEIQLDSGPVLLTEGEKKSLASEQAGVPAIGLCGPWGWTKKRERDKAGHAVRDFELVDDLAAVDWHGRVVVLVQDLDPRRNPQVSQGFCELARILHEKGADLRFLSLPITGRDTAGLPIKMGVDDFILARNPEEFRALFLRAAEPKQPPRNIKDFRAEIQQSRLDSVGVPAVYFDGSPTGAGKSFSDVQAILRVDRSLTVQPTHKNCRQTAELYCSHSLDAAAYPALNKDSCENFSEAEKVIQSGLSASQTVCQDCKFANKCNYRFEIEYAEASPHQVVTHHRAMLCLESLARGMQYIAFHEDATTVLRPKVEIRSGLRSLIEVCEYARADLLSYQAAEDHFLWRMIEVAETLERHLVDSSATKQLDLSSPVHRPQNLEILLYRSMKRFGRWPSGDVVQLVRSIVAGEISELSIRVDECFSKGGEKRTSRSIVGFKVGTLPQSATIWVSDATADVADIERLTGRTVINKTPPGEIERVHDIRQLCFDITQSSAPSRVADAIRTAFLLYPNATRAGVITHRRHVPIAKGTAKGGDPLGAEYRSKIRTAEHFRGTTSRGFNGWHQDCDLLIIVGTPRVPPSVVRSRLQALGLNQAAARTETAAEWTRDYWSGLTVTGRRRTVRTLGYRDHDWHHAYRSLVHAELVQCVGRARSILSEGIPAIVISSEPLGFPILDLEKPISESQQEILNAIAELSAAELWQPFPTGVEPQAMATFPYMYLVGEGCHSVPTSSVADRVNKSRAYVKEVLAELERSGLVERIGERGGWRLRMFSSPTPSAKPDAPPPAAVPDNQPATTSPKEPTP